MSRDQMLRGQMSPWELESVLNVHSHFIVKPNLVLRLGWGFDNTDTGGIVIPEKYQKILHILPNTRVLPLRMPEDTDTHNRSLLVLVEH